MNQITVNVVFHAYIDQVENVYINLNVIIIIANTHTGFSSLMIRVFVNVVTSLLVFSKDISAEY